MKDALLNNLGLKVMSIALAVILWLLVYAQHKAVEEISVHYNVELPADLRDKFVIVSQNPVIIPLRVSGTPDSVQASSVLLDKYEDLGLLDSLFDVSDDMFGNITPLGGSLEIPLPTRKLSFPGNAEIFVKSRTTITLELDAMRRFELPVQVPEEFDGQLPPEYERIEAVCIPNKVEAFGPSRAITHTDVVRTSRIMIGAGGFTPAVVARHVPLVKDIRGTRVETADTVLVEVKFIPLEEEWTLEDIRLEDLTIVTGLNAKFRVRVDPTKWEEEEKTLKIKGPAPSIRLLQGNKDLYQLRVDLTDIKEPSEIYFAEIHMVTSIADIAEKSYPTLPLILEKVSE